MNIEEIRCSKCHSTQTYVLSTTSRRRCRSCGHTEYIKLEEINSKGGKNE